MSYGTDRFTSNVTAADFEIEVSLRYAEDSVRKLVYGHQMEQACSEVPAVVQGPFREQTLDYIWRPPFSDSTYGVVERASASYGDLGVLSYATLWVPLGVDSDTACEAAHILAETCVQLVISRVELAVTG